MDFKINCSPHLTMVEITKQLFNQKFLSDISFSVEGKIIYAHSLELMKRSETFQKQLSGTCGEQKLIPIPGFRYESFLEFIRFIYTDECVINDGNGIELLKLAIKYKVIKLENQLLNSLDTIKWCIRLFEFCVIDDYKLARNSSEIQFAFNFSARLKSNQFMLLHPEALNAILEFDKIEKGVTEIQVLNGLLRWINNFCTTYEIPLSDGRHRFDDLIRKIRFSPNMPMNEIRQCVARYPGILTETDLMSINKQIISKRSSCCDFWNRVPREKCEPRFCWNTFPFEFDFVTTLSVSKEVILHGLWIGVAKNRSDIQITISAKNRNTKKCEILEFTQASPKFWNKMAVSLGDSICLKPKFDYSITVKYLETHPHPDKIIIFCRNENEDLIYNDTENSIETIDGTVNIEEILFKLPS